MSRLKQFAAFACFFSFLFFSAASLFADDWTQLENALKEGGMIKEGDSNAGSTTETTKLEGGGTRTVVTNADGSRTVTIEGRTTAEPANHTMNFDKDGHVTSESKGYSDGSTSTTSNNADGTTVTHSTTAEGMQVGTVFGQDESSITTSSGGGSEPTETRKSPDGTMTTTVNHADGTKTQTTNHPGGEVTTNEIGANGQTTSQRVNHTDGTHTNTEYKDGKPHTGTRFSSGGYPRPIADITYDANGVKTREVHRDRWGKIIEIIDYNPDGTERRRSRDPNYKPDPWGDSFGSTGGSVDSRDAQHEIANQDSHEHHGGEHA
jgi:hypothetical protein